MPGGAIGLVDVEVLETVLAHELSYTLLQLIGGYFVWPTINIVDLSFIWSSY